MSRIYFHTPSGDAEILGSERAYMGGVTDRFGTDAIRSCFIEKDVLFEEYINPRHPRYLEGKRMSLTDWEGPLGRRVMSTLFEDTPLFRRGDQLLDTWQVILNSCLAAGSDSIKLLARIHAQCEIHGFVEGEDRNWFADMIEAGRRDNILRGGAGWEELVIMLRSRDDEPVVMSYSVCDSFPNRYTSTWDERSAKVPFKVGDCSEGHEDRSICNDMICYELDQDHVDEFYEECWYDLTSEEQWTYGMAALRHEKPWARLQPKNWDRYRFGHNVSIFDLYEDRWNRRLKEMEEERKALGY